MTRRGTRRSLAGSVAPWRLRATRVSSSPFLRSSRKPRSAPVMASAASTTEFSTSWRDRPVCSVRATSRMARSLARLAPAPGTLPHRPGLLVRAELADQPVQLGAVHGEDELVGIRKAQLDAVGVAQRVAFHALAVDDKRRGGCRRLQRCTRRPRARFGRARARRGCRAGSSRCRLGGRS